MREREWEGGGGKKREGGFLEEYIQHSLNQLQEMLRSTPGINMIICIQVLCVACSLLHIDGFYVNMCEQ